MPCVLAIDAGTTSVRTLAVGSDGGVLDVAQRPIAQHYPRPGWVEHDASEIWSSVQATLVEVADRLDEDARPVVAIGITNQRETVVAWDRRSGRALHRAIVWQDRRTASRCEELEAAGHLSLVRSRTGLVLDPYFSATKMRWLIDHGVASARRTGDLALGTVDSWLLWHLTGGTRGGAFATDVTNASRTLLYDIHERAWSEELCDLFGVPAGVLPEVRPSCGHLGEVAAAAVGGNEVLRGVSIAGIAGDQQAALFGQACCEPGMAKVTYGTGSFVLLTCGPAAPTPPDGLVVTMAWDLGDHGGAEPVAYALEGSAFNSGSAIQWLRDGLGLIGEAAAVGPLAASVPDAGGLVMVPAFTGMGSPWWDPSARGAVVGITRGTGRAQLARAVIEAMAFQVRDMVDAMTSEERPLCALRADGGAAVMDLLLQLQADQLQVRVERPRSTETTALGAAYLAGLSEGYWSDLDELAGLWRAEASFAPSVEHASADIGYAPWRRALQAAGGWADSE